MNQDAKERMRKLRNDPQYRDQENEKKRQRRNDEKIKKARLIQDLEYYKKKSIDLEKKLKQIKDELMVKDSMITSLEKSIEKFQNEDTETFDEEIISKNYEENSFITNCKNNSIKLVKKNQNKT